MTTATAGFLSFFRWSVNGSINEANLSGCGAGDHFLSHGSKAATRLSRRRGRKKLGRPSVAFCLLNNERPISPPPFLPNIFWLHSGRLETITAARGPQHPHSNCFLSFPSSARLTGNGRFPVQHFKFLFFFKKRK